MKKKTTIHKAGRQSGVVKKLIIYCEREGPKDIKFNTVVFRLEESGRLVLCADIRVKYIRTNESQSQLKHLFTLKRVNLKFTFSQKHDNYTNTQEWTMHAVNDLTCLIMTHIPS